MAQSSVEAVRMSTETVHMVREEKNQVTGAVMVIEAHLPCGKGYLRGNLGPLDWINKGCGWRTYEEYTAAKNSEQAALKREEAKAAAAEKGKK